MKQKQWGRFSVVNRIAGCLPLCHCLIQCSPSHRGRHYFEDVPLLSPTRFLQHPLLLLAPSVMPPVILPLMLHISSICLFLYRMSSLSRFQIMVAIGTSLRPAFIFILFDPLRPLFTMHRHLSLNLSCLSGMSQAFPSAVSYCSLLSCIWQLVLFLTFSSLNERLLVWNVNSVYLSKASACPAQFIGFI